MLSTLLQIKLRAYLNGYRRSYQVCILQIEPKKK